MRFEIIKQFLERHSNNDKIGQFAVDWVEVELDVMENREITDNDEATFCGALSWRVGTLLEIMKEDAPCRAFFRELHLLCEPPSAERNGIMLKLWSEYPPENLLSIMAVGINPNASTAAIDGVNMDDNEKTNVSPLQSATCSTCVWQKTSETLPITDVSQITQVKVILYSKGWATPLVGLFSRLAPDYVRWAVYDQQNDKYLEFNRTPEFWCKFPERPK